MLLLKNQNTGPVSYVHRYSKWRFDAGCYCENSTKIQRIEDCLACFLEFILDILCIFEYAW